MESQDETRERQWKGEGKTVERRGKDSGITRKGERKKAKDRTQRSPTCVFGTDSSTPAVQFVGGQEPILPCAAFGLP